jgi:Tfp pilus assembly protein PilO
VDTTGGNELRPSDEELTRPDGLEVDPLDAVELDDGGPIEESELEVTGDIDADVVGVADAETAQDGAVSADSEDSEPAEAEDGAEPVPEGGKLGKVRSLSQFKIDGDRLKGIWRSHSLGRIALLAVVIYALAVGSAYFFGLQPISTRLHEVREQKTILHDYMVIQQAGAAIGTFKDGLMTGDQRLTVMSEVKLMAEGSGVKLVGDPDLLLRREGSGHFVEYPIRLRIKGTYHEIGEFLSLLESSPRFAIVEDVEVRSEVASRSRESEATVLISLAAWEG